MARSELSPYTWQLIAQLEAEAAEIDPGNALDQFITQHLTQEYSSSPCWHFPWLERFKAFTQPPAAPTEPGIGTLTLIQTDFRGQPIAEENQRTVSYCVLGRLFGQELSPQLLEVTLPGYMSPYLLSKLFYHQGNAYRLDLFGGNRMKCKRPKVEQRSSDANVPPSPSVATYGTLLAVPLSETQQESDLAQLLKQLFPYKESFFYFQRALLAAPPEGIEPNTAVLEGLFPITIFPDSDRIPHALVLKGELQLRLQDGCGFIKASLAQRMTVVTNVATTQSKQSYLPAQALQHYKPGDERLLREITKHLEETPLAELPLAGDCNHCFRYLTSGNISGQLLRALPAADNKVHWIGADRVSPGILIGRAPYEQANLRPIAAERVVADKTADFLAQEAVVIQYSFVGLEATPDTAETAPPLWFAKGLLIVIPDEYWPEGCRSEVLLSAADVKSHSSWRKEKQRVTEITHLQAPGILIAINTYAPGSVVALPIDEQRKLYGDFDGDQVLLIADRAELYRHVADYEQQQPSNFLAVPKPPKSHTAAFDEQGCYVFGRVRQMATLYQQVLERYATLQNCFLALPIDKRQQLADEFSRTFYSATDVGNTLLGEQVPEIVESINSKEPLRTLEQLLTRGIKAGTDAYKSDTALAQFSILASHLQSLFSRNQVPQSVPYGKGLLRTLQGGYLDVAEIKQQLQGNPTLIAQAMSASVDRLEATGVLKEYTKPNSLTGGIPIRSAEGG